jgi:hypothetical protein
VFAFDLLHRVFANGMVVWVKMAALGTPAIHVKARDAQWLEYRFQLEKNGVLTCPKDRGQDLPWLMINGVPEPSWLALDAHEAPHLIHLGFVDQLDDYLNRLGISRLKSSFVDVLEGRGLFLSVSMTVVELTPRTRTIARTPLPLSAMSTICCLIAGKRPLSWYCKRKMRRAQSGL